MSSKAEATKKEKYSWALLNTATICTIRATLIIPLTHQNHFSLSAFSLFISLILITLTGIMMLSIGDHEKDEKIIIINIKSALLCLFTAICLVISYRLNLGSVNLFHHIVLLTEQQNSEKIIFALMISITLLFIIFFLFFSIFAYTKILEQANDLEENKNLIDKLNDDHSSLEKLAHYDTLTGLYNRRAFMEAFTGSFKRITASC